MRNVFLIILLCVFVISCDSDSVYHQYVSIENGWNINEPVVLEIEQLDSIKSHNVFITLRNDNRYSYSNLYLITEMQFPQGRTLIDTLEYGMAAPDGAWLGEGFGDIKESTLWYKEGVRFRESGIYTFNIHHAVRKNGNISGDVSLKGITEIGLRIEEQQ